MRTFGSCCDAAAERALEQRPAEQHAVEPALELRLVVAVLEPADAADDVAWHGAGVEQVALEPGKSVFRPRRPLASSP